MLSWTLCWVVVAASTGVVWEFAVDRSLHPDLTLARGVMVFLALACSIVPVALLDLFGGLAQYAWDQYEWSFARWIVALAAVMFLVIALPYAWFATLVLKHIWPRISPWFAGMGSMALFTSGGGKAWMTWVVLAAITAGLIGVVFSMLRRHPFYAYNRALAVLGLRRFIAGMCLMAYLRLLLPRRDFFMQAPVVSWMPALAFAVVLRELIPNTVFAVAIPVLLLMLAAPMWGSALAAPLWIFLGTSEFDSFRTFYDLRATWRRHGLTLLSRTGEGGQEFYAAWRSSLGRSLAFYDPAIGRLWSLRTRPQMWQTAVRLLAAFVPVIVIDMRRQSDPVQFEIEWLARHDFMDKVYMIVSHEAGSVTHSTGHLVDEETLMQMRWNDQGLVSAAAGDD